MALSSMPIIASATKERLQVAAIDFGTTYSGYAMSFRSEFLQDPLKIFTNQWRAGYGKVQSLKTSSCILFSPDKKFDSFGFEAEDKYAGLTVEGNHHNWYFFKRFKMILYQNQELTRDTHLTADNGFEMPAITVFSESIRYLKDHLIAACQERSYGLRVEEIHWVLTVPAIWDDTAKQFMREAAVNAGIATDQLSLALEPEAASLYCRHLPVEIVNGNTISCFSPGKKYIVLDAGGGTVDITVHETQTDGTVRERYKANGGPWGGTKIDEAFQNFLSSIAGEETMARFQCDHRDDFNDLMREFEIKKTGFSTEMDQKVTFKLPISMHEIFQNLHGEDFRRSLMTRQDLRDHVTFAGDKVRVSPEQVKVFFKDTCDSIISHLKSILNEPAVKGTDTILMVGGFSESKMLQDAVKKNLSGFKVIIPAEAGLAVLKGAVIFGHKPTAIATRVSKLTYGVQCNKPFNGRKHPEERLEIHDNKAFCRNCFDKHVEIDQEIEVGMVFKERQYIPTSRTSTQVELAVVTSNQKNPMYSDEPGCDILGKIEVDLSDIASYDDREILVKMIYGGTELEVEARIPTSGKLLKAAYDFLG